MSEWKAGTVRAGDAELAVWETGSGRPLLVIHDELGPVNGAGWIDDLAQTHRLIMPVQPGSRGERIGWVRNVRDLAALYGWMLRSMKTSAVDVIGFSFGGWVAAQMAVANPSQFKKMALVAPFGIKPDQGFIMDFFPMTAADYLKASFCNPDSVAELSTLYGEANAEQYERWEDSRTECARLAWEPFMHDPSLRPLLGSLEGLPAALFWGEDDAVLPESAVRAYETGLPQCQRVTFKQCGHRPEIESREAFVEALSRFLG